MKIRRALLSVSDKQGIVELAAALKDAGVEILSTGGTMKLLRDEGIPVVGVSTFTGSPEVMAGRVKTLHPKIHAGLLFRRDNPDDVQQLAELDSKAIDLLVVNLYPFEKTVARDDATHDEIIENIDIGGPAMIRSASKNHISVTVVVDPSDYPSLLKELEENGGATSLEFRQRCATRAFQMTSAYDTAIAGYFAGHGEQDASTFPDSLIMTYRKGSSLRYGENPHQSASVYAANQYSGPTLVRAEVLSGKELSYNNYGDLDATLDMLLDFSEPFACVVKHANPCGAATADSLAEAYRLAFESDPLSAFGSIIGLNREVDMDTARLLHDTQFVECILAPGFSDEVFKLLKKKKSRRLLALPEIAGGRPLGRMVQKHIQGGLLLQTEDTHEISPGDLKVVSQREPTPDEIRSMLFAWKVVKHTKSNAIVLAKGTATVGIGMGQTSRVDSGFMAVKRASERAKGAVMASDAFFPMPDGVEVGTDAGVTAIIQPGGSKGDEKAIAAADKAGAAMVFTGVRHFKH
ncbi:MAG: bifunctional phosphoribosylaminoimidazolecarboxamide formyltransferase/IMP cyclohydrolase [Candidatus Zixiibacteriota bacterium]|nr:MAG: bifunctional phosphoribosylaminoimidazolecarboxamide formyltransferase/IMP cyclohydrolase [candidate division Zixibacteria bacterium]